MTDVSVLQQVFWKACALNLYYLLIFSAWRRSTKSDHEDDSSSEMPNGCRDNYGSDHVTPLPSGGTLPGAHQKRRPMSFKAASKATLSFLTARRRIEDGLRSFSKRRQSTRESICDGKHYPDLLPPPLSPFSYRHHQGYCNCHCFNSIVMTAVTSIITASSYMLSWQYSSCYFCHNICHHHYCQNLIILPPSAVLEIIAVSLISNDNRNLLISVVPNKAQLLEPAYSQAI